jgi:2-phospho-L-lactate guanylyltransferase
VSGAVVPVKSLSQAKSRLLPDLDRAQHEALSLAMLEDVLAALLATPALDRVAVATPDVAVAARARALGAEALLGPDPGLNAAIDTAARKLHMPRDEPFLVVLGDVAGARPEDLQRLFEALSEIEMPGEPAVVLAPSRDGGSSALLRVPHDAIPSRFGPDSAALHRQAAAAAGVAFRELQLESLAIDLDRAEDLEDFLAGAGDGPRTRAMLAELGIARARHLETERGS